MSVIIDSYSESNESSNYGNYYSVGQSFQNNVISTTLDSVEFYLRSFGSPTGNIIAQLYDHTGTYGTSSLPNGPALAMSDNIDVSTIGTSPNLITFNFSGVNRVALLKGSIYVATYQYGNGNGSNFIIFFSDNTNSTHNGNLVKKGFSSSSWEYVSDSDSIFYVYGDSGPVIGQKYPLPPFRSN